MPVRRALLEQLADAGREAFGVFLPAVCAGCGDEPGLLCRGCRPMLAPTPHPVPAVDGLPAVAALDYGGLVARVIGDYKEQGRTGLARPLGLAFGAAVREALRALPAGPGSVIAVAVPSSRAAMRRRGWQPVPLLARRAGIRVLPALRVRRPVADQAGLDREQRQRNLAGAFAADTVLRGRGVLLLDDVLTTGATLAEAARAVRVVGGRPLAVAVLARVASAIESREAA